MRIQDDFELAVTNAANMATDGAVILVAPATIDNVGAIALNQTTLSRNLTLPNPATSMPGKRMVVFNSGTARFQMYNININPLTSKTFSWNGTIWRAETDNSIGWADTRTVNGLPQDYGAGVYWEFKQASSLGLSANYPEAGTYVGLMTLRKYAVGTVMSGGQIIQKAYADNNIVYTRVSTSAAAWGPWTGFPKIVAPTVPTITVSSGAMTITPTWLQTIVDGDSVTYKWRVTCNIPAHTTTWQTLLIPNIAGYAAPIVTTDGTYRSAGNPAGLPAAPWMGSEACVYTANTIYVGGYTEAVATSRLVMVNVRYVKL